MTLLLKQINSETNILLSTKVIREREKRGFINNFYRLEVVTDVFALKYCPVGKRDIFMKNGNEIWDVLGDSRKRYRGPWAEIGKY